MFNTCKSEEEVKEMYRKLAHLLHPDKGGSCEMMVLLQEAKDLAIDEVFSNKGFKKHFSEQNKKEGLRYKRQFEDVYLDDEELKVIEEINKYEEKTKSFNSNFFNSIKKQLRINGKITCAQYNALINIYYSFHMDEEEE